MHINKRVMAAALVSLLALASMSCKDAGQNAAQQNSNQAAGPQTTARWIGQFRSPAAAGITGTALSTYWYSSISVVSPDVVFVAGDMPRGSNLDESVGVVVRTTDGGRSWKEFIMNQPAIQVARLNSCSFISPTTGWVVGLDPAGAGIVGKTTDAGESWTFAKLGFKQAPTSVFFADENNGWMGGATADPDNPEEDDTGGPSDLLFTTDGGASWQTQRRMPVTISDLFFLDKNNGWACGHKGAIYKTTDGGRTWIDQRSEFEFDPRELDPTKDRGKKFTISGIHFVDPQNGYAAVGAKEVDLGRIIGTSNGGSSWSRKLIAYEEKLKDVYFINANEGWAITDHGEYIYYTADGGRSWIGEPVKFEQQIPLHRISGADASRVWAVGGGAILFRVSE